MTDRRKELQPIRVDYAKAKLFDIGATIVSSDETRVVFEYKGYNAMIYPYSGWYSGKGLKQGRGIENLLQQLKEL